MNLECNSVVHTSLGFFGFRYELPVCVESVWTGPEAARFCPVLLLAAPLAPTTPLPLPAPLLSTFPFPAGVRWEASSFDI